MREGVEEHWRRERYKHTNDRGRGREKVTTSVSSLLQPLCVYQKLRKSASQIDAGALCLAASSNDSQAVEMFISNGCDVNAKDFDRRTALHLAAAEDAVNAVQVLVENGADLHARDR